MPHKRNLMKQAVPFQPGVCSVTSTLGQGRSNNWQFAQYRLGSDCRGYFFPGTGGPSETGRGAGEGFTVNVPWPCGGMGNGDYMAAFQHLILPITYEFSPDLIIISAGYDAAEGDPLGG